MRSLGRHNSSETRNVENVPLFEIILSNQIDRLGLHSNKTFRNGATTRYLLFANINHTRRPRRVEMR